MTNAQPVQVLCQDRTNSGNGTTTTAASITTSNANHAALLAYVDTASGSNSCSGISDGSGTNTWTRLGSSVVGSSNTLDVYQCLDSAVLTGAVTANFTGSGNARELLVVEYPPGSTFPVTNGQVNSAATLTPAADQVTPQHATDVVAGIIAFRSNTAPTVGGSYTLYATQNHSSGSVSSIAMAWLQESSTATDGPAFTLPSSLVSVAFTHTAVAAATGSAATFLQDRARQAGAFVRAVLARRSRVAAFVPPQETPPSMVPMPVQARRHGFTPRRGTAFAVPTPQPVTPPPAYPASTVGQPRRLRHLLPRRGRVVRPVPAQVNPPIVAPAPRQPRLLRALGVRRGRGWSPVRSQVVIVPPAYPPGNSRRPALRPVPVRRGRIGQVFAFVAAVVASAGRMGAGAAAGSAMGAEPTGAAAMGAEPTTTSTMQGS